MNFLKNIRARGFFLVFVSISFVVGLFFVTRMFFSQKQNNNFLIVGMLPADAPFYSINESGEPEGFDVDVARAIAQRMGKSIEFKELSVPELFMALQVGKVDMFLCGLSITKKRLEKIAMVHYQGEGVKTFPLVFWKNAPQNIRSLHDVQDKNFTLAVLPGTVQEDFARQYDGITIKSVNSYADIILELRYGKSDAALFDEALYGFIKKFPDLQVLEIPIGEFESLGHGIAIGKENNPLVSHVEKIVQELKHNGTIVQFERQWQMGGVS